MTDYAIIFGAAVRPDGRLSPTLARRVASAVGWAREHPDCVLIPTGGREPSGQVEAEAMRRALLAAGIAPERIIVEPHARDTLESVRLCDAILRRRGDVGRVIVCTSGFHQPRCALLFRLRGYAVVLPRLPHDLRHLPALTWLHYVAREIAATPWDTLLLLLDRTDRPE